LNGIEARDEAEFEAIIAAGLAVIAEQAKALVKFLIVGGQHAAVAAGIAH